MSDLGFLSADARAELERLIAEAVATEVSRRLATDARDAARSPYLNVAEAAEYLRCSRQRIYDLLSARRLTRRKDGARVLVSRAELDAHLTGQ